MTDLEQILQRAAADARVVAVGVEGSHNNPQATVDAWSDLDVTVFVSEPIAAWNWVRALGQPVIWQHLANRDLFGKSSAVWDTYLVRYAGMRRIDWKFAPVADIKAYLAADSLNTLVWQAGHAPALRATDATSHAVVLPNESQWQAVVNEVLWCAGNVIKALHRHNLVHANEQLNANVRPGVLQLLSWQVASRQPGFNAGSQWKFLAQALPAAQAQSLAQSYAQASPAETTQSLSELIDLASSATRKLAVALQFPLPEWFELGLAQLHETL